MLLQPTTLSEDLAPYVAKAPLFFTTVVDRFGGRGLEGIKQMEDLPRKPDLSEL